MPSDRVPANYRVDPKVKQAFEQYVDSLGETAQGRYGRHLETAMREYVHADRLTGIHELLNRMADNLGVEKVSKTEAVADGRYAAPQGKNPGDVRRRVEVISDAILDQAEAGRTPSDDYGPFVNRKIVKSAIEDVGDVHSDKTVKKYLKKILKQSMFRPHPERTNAWVVEP